MDKLSHFSDVLVKYITETEAVDIVDWWSV